MDVRTALERVKEGSMPLEEAEEYLKKLPYERGISGVQNLTITGRCGPGLER